jgi:hypothetical protein
MEEAELLTAKFAYAGTTYDMIFGADIRFISKGFRIMDKSPVSET